MTENEGVIPNRRQQVIRRAVEVSASRGLSLVVSFACATFTVRLMLSALGPQAYGAASLVGTLVALLPFADFGLGVALTNQVVKYGETGNIEDLRRTYTVTVCALTAIGLAVIVAGTVLSAADIWERLLGRSIELLGNSQEFMLAYCVLFLGWLWSALPYRVLYGLGRAATVMLLQVVTPVLTLIATFALVVSGSSVTLFVFVPMVANVLTAIIARTISRRALRAIGSRSLLVSPKRIALRDVTRTMRSGLGGVGLVLGTALILQSDRLLISLRGTSHQLALAAIILPLYFAAQSFLGAIGSFLWPHYAKLQFKSSLLNSTVLKHSLLFTVLGALMAAAFVVLVPIYFNIVNYRAKDAEGSIVVLAIVILLQASTLAYSSVASHENSLQTLSRVSLLGGAVKIVLAIWLISFAGATGSFAATAIALVATQLPGVTLVGSRSLLRARRAVTQ